MADSFDERAARRRREWRGGVAHSFAEMGERDVDFWLDATPGERVRGILELNRELALLRGEDGSVAGFHRSAFGVRRRQS